MHLYLFASPLPFGSRLGKLIRYPLSPLFAPNPPHPGGYGGLALASPTEDAHRIVQLHMLDHQQADFQSAPAGFQPRTSTTINTTTGRQTFSLYLRAFSPGLSVRSIGRQTFSLNLRAFSPEPPQPQTQQPAGRLSVCTCGLSALDFQSNIQRGDGGKPLPHTMCGRANPIPPCAPCGRRLRT